MNRSSDRLLVEARGAVLVRNGSDFALGPLDWQWREGQFWAVVGPAGCGKTTFAEGLLGRHRLAQGHLNWPMLESLKDDQGRPPWPSEVGVLVGFREESRAFSHRGLYYQQRFEFAEEAQSPRVGAFVRETARHDSAKIDDLLRRWGLDRLAEQPLITLSHGETRKARLARAYLARPEWLILDDPLAGLDAASREDLSTLLDQWIAQGARILLLARDESLPRATTHILDLRDPRNPRSLTRGEWASHRGTHLDQLAHQTPRPNSPTFGNQPDAAPEVIGLEKVTVRMGERTLLDQIDWIVRQGERWRLAGPNGAGKTTLLSLLCGDHPQAFCNTVRLFGKQRGTGETIWDIKRQVGLVSPELHHYFQEPLSALETVVTGFFDVMARRSGSPAHIASAQEWLRLLGLEDQADQPFRVLSTGAQKTVLLARALVKQPPLLILDEPFQGMDAAMVARAKTVLAEALLPHQTLIFVSHLANESLECLDRTLILEAGRVVGRS